MSAGTQSPARDRLIVALDVGSVAAASALVETLGDSAGTYKIGLELLMGDGIALARDLIAGGACVFLDAKLLDISNTVERAVAQAAELGAWCLTIHAHDAKTCEAAVRGRADSPLALLGVSVLTHLDRQDLTEQGIALALEDVAAARARRAIACGLDGVVCSGQEVSGLRADLGPDPLIVVPGIRPPGADAGDQARVTTPAQALHAGASHLVVGRPITQADDPRAACEAIVAEMQAALEA